MKDKSTLFELQPVSPFSLPTQPSGDYTIQLQSKKQGSLSPQFPVRGLSSWEEQDVIVSHPVSSYTLLRINTKWVKKQDFVHLSIFISWNEGYTLNAACWECWGPRSVAVDVLYPFHEVGFSCQAGQQSNRIIGDCLSTSQWTQHPLRKKLAIVPKPLFQSPRPEFWQNKHQKMP